MFKEIFLEGKCQLHSSKDVESMKIGSTCQYKYQGEEWGIKRTKEGFLVYSEDQDQPHLYKTVQDFMVDFKDLGISYTI